MKLFKQNPRAWTTMLFMLLMVMPEMSWALSFFTPAADDVSVNALLSKLFGSAIPGGGGGSGTDPFAGFFGVLNAGALAVGGILAAYNLVVGSMQTAHEGEMLGRKWSSMWLPIRTAMGTAMVAPLGTGYCVAQLIVMWIAFQGIGLADKGWSAFVSTGFDQLVASSSHAAPNVNTLAANALRIQTCMTVLEKISQDAPAIAASERPQVTSYTGGVFSRQFGTNYGTASNPNYCGEISIDSPSLSERASSNTAHQSGWSYAGGILSAFGQSFTPAQLTQLQQKHQEQSNQLVSAAKPLAQYLIKISQASKTGNDAAMNMGTEKSLTDAYFKAIQNYQQAIVTIADGATTQGSLQALKADSTKGGWMMAGAWFPRVAAYMNSINTAVNSTPSSKLGGITDVDGDSSAIEKNLWINVSSNLDGLIKRNGLGGGDSPLAGVGEGNSDSLGWGAAIGRGLGSLFTSINISELSHDTRHPVFIAQEIGDRMATMGMTLYAGMLALWGASKLSLGGLIGKAVGAGAGASAPVFFLAAPIALGATLLFGFGYYLKIFLPLMPFIHFFFASLSWVLLVCEAMIAAPLWAVMHLTGSGDDIMGGSRNGYAILLGLLLRPMLLIAGFISAIIVMYPIGLLFNSIYFSVLKMSMVEGAGFVDGAVLMIAGLAIYCMLITSLYTKVLRLISDVPNQALQWFGAQGSQIGNSGQQAAEGIGGKLKGGIVGGVMGQALSSGFSNIGQGSLNDMKMKKEKAKARDQADPQLQKAMINEGKLDAGISQAMEAASGINENSTPEQLESAQQGIQRAMNDMSKKEDMHGKLLATPQMQDQAKDADGKPVMTTGSNGKQRPMSVGEVKSKQLDEQREALEKQAARLDQIQLRPAEAEEKPSNPENGMP